MGRRCVESNFLHPIAADRCPSEKHPHRTPSVDAPPPALHATGRFENLFQKRPSPSPARNLDRTPNASPEFPDRSIRVPRRPPTRPLLRRRTIQTKSNLQRTNRPAAKQASKVPRRSPPPLVWHTPDRR